jgi:hypothetical protein
MTSSQSQHHPSPQTQPPPIPLKHQSLFTLPVYSDELGRLPLHDQGGFLPPPQAPMDPAQMAQWFAPNLTPSMPSTSSTGPPAQASYPPPDINMPSSFSMDSFLYEQMGMSYASPFAQTTSSGSSQSTSQSAFAGNPGGPIFSPMGAEINPQQMGMMPGRFPSASMNANAQALIDSDTIAMWSNAPTGFECVVCSCVHPCSCANYPTPPVDWTIGAPISQMSASLPRGSIIPPDRVLPETSASKAA